MTFRTVLVQKLNRALEEVFPGCLQGGEAEVVQSTQERFGHYQCNSCLKIGKQLGKNPREVAGAIAEILSRDSDLATVEVAGPGFINMGLRTELLERQLGVLLKDPFLGVARTLKGERIIVEFSSPNVAKELHVGHLRSTIIGDCLARVLEFLGGDILRLNHIGDWGTQFGMLIHLLKLEHPLVLSGQENTDLSHLMKWYRESKKRFDEDPEFKKNAQQEVVRLQRGDADSKKAWEIICAISREAFEEIYALLGVKIQERGESFYNPFLQQIVDDLEQKGLITISDGAKCIFLPGFMGRDGQSLPMIIQKSDGGFNYDTTDVAAVWHRVSIEKADRVIIVTDAGQSLHFQMVFQVAEKGGYCGKTQLDHVPFGVILGSDGKKFKTRSGDTEKLIDLLQEAIDRAETIMQERLPQAGSDEQKHAAKVLGIGAVKYADLSCNRIKDYVFSYDRMLKFEGNTAAFLLYAFVRIQGIKRKGGWSDAMLANPQISLSHPSEISLALHLCQLGETLELIAKELLPNRLADYLYVLAEKFHAFYRDCRVEGTQEANSRLLLCEAAGKVLQKGLFLLGLDTIERM